MNNKENKTDIDKMVEEMEKIPMNLLNFKKYRKNIRKRFEAFRTICRFHLFEDYNKKYSQTTKTICDVLFKTLDNPNTFVIGNQHFLFSLIESHMDFLDTAKQKCRSLDKDCLHLIFDVIIQKNEELKNILISNVDNPVNKEQFLNFMNQKE